MATSLHGIVSVCFSTTAGRKNYAFLAMRAMHACIEIIKGFQFVCMSEAQFYPQFHGPLNLLCKINWQKNGSDVLGFSSGLEFHTGCPSPLLET